MPGAFGSGGARPGAGQPPKPLEQKILEGTASGAEKRAYAAGLPAVPPRETRQRRRPTRPVVQGSVERPAGLTRAQQRVWDALAPHAIAAHTLTPATARSFRTVVEVIVEREKIWKKLVRDGWEQKVVRRSTVKGRKPVTIRTTHPLLKVHQLLHSSETLGLHRFKLTAAAKEMDFVEPLPAAADPKQAPVDPFQEFDRDAADAATETSDEDAAPAVERHH